jgi:hypothetical protein
MSAKGKMGASASHMSGAWCEPEEFANSIKSSAIEIAKIASALISRR